MSIKKAAEELLKVADEIEKEAADVTTFVCDKCNHTASMSAINQKRREAAETSEEKVTVAEITVNDKIECPACDGTMAYNATDESKAYYFEPKKADESDPLDYDSLERYS